MTNPYQGPGPFGPPRPHPAGVPAMPPRFASSPPFHQVPAQPQPELGRPGDPRAPLRPQGATAVGASGPPVALILLVVVLVAAVGLGAWAVLWRNPAGPAPAASGGPSAPSGGGGDLASLAANECLQFVEVDGATPAADGSIPVDHRVVDCSLTGQFKLVVASVTAGEARCATSDYVRYYREGWFGTTDSRTVCLAPVFEVDYCYAPDAVLEYQVTPCTDPASYFRVEADLTGTSTASCTIPEDAMVLPEPTPGRVYCLGARE